MPGISLRTVLDRDVNRKWTDTVPGMTTIKDSWKPYVRHVLLHGFFDTIHKTLQNLKGDQWRLLDHVVQQIYRKCHWPSRKNFFLWCLGYNIQDHRLLWPIQDHKTFFCNITFWLKNAINNVLCGFQTKIGDLKIAHEKIWCLEYHFQNHRLLWPYPRSQNSLCNFIFLLQIIFYNA